MPVRRSKTGDEQLCPLWRFGWAGWVALGVLGFEFVWLYVDSDPVRSFQVALARLGAWTINPVTFWIIGLQMQLAYVALHPLTAWPLFMAIMIHPRHTEWWRWAVLTTAAILSPLVWIYTTTIARLVWDAAAWAGLPIPARPVFWAAPTEFYEAMVALFGGAAIWFAVRSRTVALLMLLIGVAWGFLAERVHSINPNLASMLAVAISLTINGLALVSAIRATALETCLRMLELRLRPPQSAERNSEVPRMRPRPITPARVIEGSSSFTPPPAALSASAHNSKYSH